MKNDNREVEILKDYVKEFQERNPNMFVFAAVIHRDESTTHLHLDYIPCGHGFKRGLEIQNSLNRALHEQGFQTDRGKGTAQKQWTEQERNEFERICRDRGIDVEHKKETREHLEKEKFILYMKNQEIEQDLDLKREVVHRLDKELDYKRTTLDRRIKSPTSYKSLIVGEYYKKSDIDAYIGNVHAQEGRDKQEINTLRDRVSSCANRAEQAETSARGEHELRLEIQEKWEDIELVREHLKELEQQELERLKELERY